MRSPGIPGEGSGAYENIKYQAGKPERRGVPPGHGWRTQWIVWEYPGFFEIKSEGMECCFCVFVWSDGADQLQNEWIRTGAGSYGAEKTAAAGIDRAFKPRPARLRAGRPGDHEQLRIW